jgi:hypothetical protein
MNGWREEDENLLRKSRKSAEISNFPCMIERE